jgi:hypothetical protein
MSFRFPFFVQRQRQASASSTKPSFPSCPMAAKPLVAKASGPITWEELLGQR